MDLDDSFTERLVQRAKARRKWINEKKEDLLSVGKKRAALVEENQVNSDHPPEESPKRQCTETLQTAYSTTYDKENIEIQDEDASGEFVPYHSASKARGLAALKKNFLKDDDDNSKAASEQQVNKCSTYIYSTNTSDLCTKEKQKETETNGKCPVKSVPEAASGKLHENLNLRQDSHEEEYSDDESIDTDDFDEDYNDMKPDNGTSKMELDYSPVKQVKEHEKLDKPTKSETYEKPQAPVLQNIVNKNVDPAELPLSARKALFEKALLGGTPKINEDVVDHKMSVAQRAAMFENASKANTVAKKTSFKESKRIALSNFSKFENNSIDDVAKSPVKTVQTVTKVVSQEMRGSPVKKLVSESSTPSPIKNVGNHTRFVQQKLMESSGSIWQAKQTAKAVEERKQEISSLVNHWEKLSSSSSTENNSETGRVHLASEEKVTCESDVDQEASESEEEYEPDDMDKDEHPNDVGPNNDDSIDDDESDYDNNEEQEDANRSNEKIQSPENVFYAKNDETGNSKSVEVYENERNSDAASTSSHNTRSIMSSLSHSGMSSGTDENYLASGSHSYSSGSSVRSYDVTSYKTEAVFDDIPEKRENKNPEINLLRTVSTYRREKQETKLTPVRTIVRNEKVSSPESPPETDYTEVIQQRLKDLQDEILRQQTVISQTSQALNLCSATAEFSGSIEQVEGERLLLIATQKRQACLNEITRLKTCGAQGQNVTDGSGTLTISDLQLPLKREFIASQLEGRGNEYVHYFLCLIRHGAQVIVTQMMSTDDKTKEGTLSFTNHIQLRNLPADFSVVFEVYALQTKKDVLPHDMKYHIKRENSKKRLTPKGKKFDGRIPAISSPGGPNAVRSPSFGVVGYTRFTIQNCNKKTFTLDKVPFTSPLEGVLRVHLQLHAENKVMLKGFLTFYEDVGEIGALFRRWCVLDGNHIAYWMYPDDEHKKEPLNTIDLRQCVTDLVKSVSSLECARPYTFKLITLRPQKKGEKNTLISRTANTLTSTKYLLTADTKDERILWCNKINEALANVRKWDPQALRPIESLQM